MAFLGWLIRCGGVELPMELIKHESFKITPDQRLDLSAERDMTGTLHRDTVAHMPVKIEFETLAINSREAEQINSIIRAAYTDRRSRTLPISFYDPEEDTYKTAVCYMPDTEYTIREIDIAQGVIQYGSLRYAFIEY